MSNINIEISFNSNFGSNGSGNGEFNYPSSITILNNEMFVSDKQNHRVQVFDLSGNYLRQFGTIGTGNDNFFFPEGIVNDGTDLFIVDGANHRIKKHQVDGTYISEFGTEGTGNNNFKYPVGLYVDLTNSLIFVADKQNNRIKAHDLTGAFVFEFGTYGSGDSNLNFPEGVAIFDNNIYVADSGNKKIKIFNIVGIYQSQLAQSFNYPVGLINIEGSIIGVIDRVDGSLLFFDNLGQLIVDFGSSGSGLNEFYFPQAGYFDNDILYITDSGNHRISIYDAIIQDEIPLYSDEITKLSKQLYPTGRAWWIKKSSNFYNLHEGLAYSESRAIENARSILDSIIPDNDNFSETDADNWERALGLITSSSLTLEERKQAILRKMKYPGTILARQHYLYIQGQLQDAGFNVYVHENRFPLGGGNYDVYNATPALYGDFNYGDNTYGYAGIGAYTKIANYVDENKDSSFYMGNDINLRSTFFIGGSVFGDYADVDTIRKNEFRLMLLQLKPAQTAGFLLINYI